MAEDELHESVALYRRFNRFYTKQIGLLNQGLLKTRFPLTQALVRIPATKVSVMMTTEVPIVACFGVLYLGEPVNWRMVVGALLIFGCGIGLNLLPTKAKPLLESSDP